MKTIGCLVTSKWRHNYYTDTNPFFALFHYHDVIDCLCQPKKITWKPHFYVKRCKTFLCTIVPSIKSFEHGTRTSWGGTKAPFPLVELCVGLNTYELWLLNPSIVGIFWIVTCNVQSKSIAAIFFQMFGRLGKIS